MRRWAATTLIAAALTSSHAQPVPAQQSALPADSVARRFGDAVRDARARLALDDGRLWGVRLDTLQWIGAGDSELYFTRDPEHAGFGRDSASGVWRGPMPAGTLVANTASDLFGRRWAMVRLPLPNDDPRGVTELLIHEAWHVVQPSLLTLPAANETGAGAALLDEPEGRTWLRLEWSALTTALGVTSPATRRRACRAALLFRARRYLVASPDERQRERVLDLSEGMAEYTGMRLAGAGGDRRLAARLRTVAGTLDSYVRAFPYQTGPAYGFLLERVLGPRWTRRLARTPDLQQLLAGTLGAERQRYLDWLKVDGDTAALRATADREAKASGGDSVRAAEEARWQGRQARLAELRARFVTGPTLRLRPHALQLSFDPRGQVSLGDAGTVMANLVWKNEQGASLTAPDGALVTPDWRELRLDVADAAITEGTLRAPATWRTTNWTLTLPAGWLLRREGAGWIASPP